MHPLRAIVVSVAALFAVTSDAVAQCATNGPGGFVPSSGAVDGLWPNVLPTGALLSTQVVSAPAGPNVVHSVKFALKHTFASDVQVVLIDPSGTAYNIVQLNNGVLAGACQADFFGVYEIVDPLAGLSCNGIGSLACEPTQLTPGTYVQEFGAWPNGAVGIVNVALEQIPVSSGAWTLAIYDWFVGSDNGALLSWELCFGSPTPLPPPPTNPQQCTPLALGGAFPLGGTSGVWPSALPSGVLVRPLSVSVPPNASKIAAVKVFGLDHEWIGDVQLVLESPAGLLYNLVQTNDGQPGGGCSDDFGGDYTFVDALGGLDPCGAPASAVACGPAVLPSRTYAQTFGTWPSGASGILNVPLEQIPLASGVWKLRCYDWFVNADDGNFYGWSLCFDVAGPPPTFCTPQVPGTTNGCITRISATGQPSLSGASNCVLSLSAVEGQKTGLFFYSVTGRVTSLWCSTSANLLCVKAPTQRTTAIDSGGTSGSCSGAIALDFDQWMSANPTAIGAPWTVGEKLWVQGWFRDPPACKTTALSEGIELTWLP